MKKQFYLLLALCLSTSVMLAQTSKQQVKYSKKMGMVPNVSHETSVKPGISGTRGLTAPIWSNGFEDESEWLIYDESVPEPLGWEITTDVNIVPNFPQVAFAIPLELEGASDGFAFINMDAGGSDASFQDAWIEYSEPINLMGAENVSLEFDFVTRNFATQYFVEFSLDDGLSWIPLEVHTEITTNVDSDNPQTFNANITSILNGASEVRFRFFVDANWGWFWAVDDVRFIETPAYDLSVLNSWYDEYILVTQEEGWLDIDYMPEMEYSEYRQGNVRPLTFVSEVLNNGSSELTGVVLTATLNTPSGSEFFTSNPITVPPTETAVVVIEDVMPEAFMNGGELGDYTVEFQLNHDNDGDEAFPADNVGTTKSFSVGTERMSNDFGDAYTGWFNIGQGTIWGNQFTLEQTEMVNYIQFVLVDGTDSPTQIDEEIFVNLRSGSVFDDEETFRFFGDEELSYIIEPDAVSTGGVSNYVTIFLDDPVELDANVIYQAEVEVPEVGSDIAFVAISGDQEEAAGVLFDFLNDPAPAWFTLGTSAPNIQTGYADLTNTNNTGNLDFFLGQNYPNPVANESTRISWSLVNPEENIRFSVIDNTGKIVYQDDLGDRPAGIQEDIVLDDLKLASGVYQYALTIGNQKAVRKMVITK